MGITAFYGDVMVKRVANARIKKTGEMIVSSIPDGCHQP